MTASRYPARRDRATAIALIASASLACRAIPPATAAAATTPSPALEVRWVGQARLASGLRLGEHEVGGLSALVYDREADLFHAVVDDASTRQPARLLRFRWHPPAEPQPIGWVLLTAEGAPLPVEGADLEGLVRTAEGTFFISSEGDVQRGLLPWVGRFDAEGRLQAKLPLPSSFGPPARRGARHNTGLEALTLEPGEAGLLAGMEGPLLQDGRERAGTLLSRLLRWDLHAVGEPRQWAYPVDLPHAEAPEPNALRVAGLVELLPSADGGHLLALERSWVAGVGFAVKLYEIWLDGATDVTGVEALGDRAVRTALKRPLADLGELGVPLDNYEGMAWGPPGPRGEPLLVLVADNNFNPVQQTWLVALDLIPRGRASSASR